VREVSNYVAALHHGLNLLKSGLPLSLRLIREVHGVLLAKGRGSRLTPGNFGAARTGSAAPAPATRPSCRRQPKKCWNA
jgi:Fic family protein